MFPQLQYYFFFQAEDGIRDYKVTGVQTCALPIYRPALVHCQSANRVGALMLPYLTLRSEEHTSELQSPCNLVCRLLLEKKSRARLGAAARAHPARGAISRRRHRRPPSPVAAYRRD